jgi:hypothetical protein
MFILDQYAEELKMVAVVKVLAYVTHANISILGYHPLYPIQSFLDPTSVTSDRTEDGSFRYLRNFGHFYTRLQGVIH